MRLLAIDFGTSNTVAALLVDGQAARTVTFDASPLLPSAVYVAANGQVTVGREAQRQARLDPTRYEPNPKRRIDDGDVLLGDRVVPVVDVIAAVLRAVAVEVRRQLGGVPPDEVRLTHPAQWGASRQNVLVAAARAAGLGANLVLLPEPVAAAAQFTQLPGRAIPAGGTVAVYDLGGGTFDVAVVGRTQAAQTGRQQGGAPAGPSQSGEFHVLAEAGLSDLGGLDFDQALLTYVGRTASGSDPARWQAIARPSDATGRRAARALAEDVRAAKETLSRYPQTEIPLPDPFVDAHVTRSEFESLIRPQLARSVEVLRLTLRSAGVGPDRLTGIFLVGGSSRIPLVAAMIAGALNVVPVALDQPETAVVLGALLVPLRRDGNRTVAMADGPPRAVDPPNSGPRPVSGHGSPSQVRPPVTGPGRPIAAPAAQRSGRKRGLLIGGGALLVVIAVVLVLVLVKPSGGAGVADPTTGSTTDRTVATGSAGSSASTSSAASTQSGSSTASPTTGLGPNQLFDAAQVSFVGPSISGLTSCTPQTSVFNESVPADLNAQQEIQCSVPVASGGSLSGPILFYLITTPSAAASVKYLSTFAAARQTDAYGSSKSDSNAAFAAGSVSGRVVTGADVPTFGHNQLNVADGATALAWTIKGQPYVGVVTSLGSDAESDLTAFWQAQYKPRG